MRICAKQYAYKIPNWSTFWTAKCDAYKYFRSHRAAFKPTISKAFQRAHGYL